MSTAARAPHLVSERALQDVIVECARLHGWECFHVLNPRGMTPGWPDLVLLRPPRALFVELKTETGKVTGDQAHVLDLLERCGLDARIVRPKDLDDVIAELGR